MSTSRSTFNKKVISGTPANSSNQPNIDLFGLNAQILSDDERARIAEKVHKAEQIAKRISDESHDFLAEDVPNKIFHECIDASAKWAKWALDNCNFAAFQRNLMHSRVLNLHRKMRDGRFHGNDIAFARFEGRLCLINGQHTLTAQDMSGLIIRHTIKVFECNTIDQLACAWAQFDDGGMRTRTQIAKNYCSTFGEGWTDGGISLLQVACSLHKFGTTAVDKAGTVEERIKLIAEYLEPAKGVHDVIFGGESKKKSPGCKMLERGPVAHAMLKTFLIDPDEAKQFWTVVKSGLGLDDAYDPRYVLNQYLSYLSLSNTNVGKGKQKEQNHTITGKCLVAWNLYRNKQQARLRGKPALRFSDESDLPQAE